MKQRFKSIALLAFTALMAVACKSSDNGAQSSETAWVKMAVQTKSEIVFPSAKAEGVDLAQIKTPAANECTVEFTTAGIDPVKKLYADILGGLELTVGNYKVKASYGENLAAGWNNAYFEGNGELLLSNSQKDASVKLDCKLASAFAFAKFDDKFRTAFKDFSVAFSTEFNADAPLVFVAAETKIASFKEAEKLWVVVTATMKSNGKKYTYGIDPVMGLKAGDLHVFNFTVQEGNAAFTVTVDNGVNVKEKTVKLNPNWVDARYTKMLLSYNPEEVLSFVYGLPQEGSKDVVITSNIGLESLNLLLDEGFAAQVGFDSLNFLTATPEQIKTVFQKIGATHVANADNQGYRVNLRGCVNTVMPRENTTTNYDFRVSYIDKSGNYGATRLAFTVIPPKIERKEQDPGKVWNRFAYIPFAEVTNVSAEDKKRFPLEYWLKEGNGEWKSRGELGAFKDIYLENLKPNTAYHTRVTLNGFDVSVQSFVTLPELQIPNSNFNDYTRTQCGSTYPYHTYEFNSSWATLNALTVSPQETAWSRSYPCVTVTDGAAEISTIGYGKNAAGNGAKIMHAWTQSIEKKDKWDRTWGNFVVGKLFLGTYSVTNGEKQGTDFSAKPTAVKFKYKFSQKNPNGPWNMQLKLLTNTGEEIGRTEFAGSNANQGEFATLNIPIKYNTDYNSKSIRSIELYFVSQTGDVAANDANLNEYYGTHRPGDANFWGTPNWKESLDSRTCGNVLTVDDIELVYPTKPEDYVTK